MSGSKQTWLLVAMWGGALLSVGALTAARMRSDGSGAVGPEAVVTGLPAAVTDAGTELPALGELRGGLVPFRSYRGDARHTGRTAIVGPREPHLRFAFATGGMIKSQVVVDEAGRLWFGTLGPLGTGDAPAEPGELIALSRRGEVVLRRPLGADVYSTPLVTSERVYVGSDADRFFSFTFAGERRFELETGDDADTGATLGPADALYFTSGRFMWATDRYGTARFRFEAQGKIYTSPAVAADGTIYIGSQDDHLYAVSPTGELRWRHRAGDDIDSSPVVGDDGAIFFGADDRRVHALEPDGTERFSVDVGGYVRAPVALTHDGGIVAAVMGPRPRVVSLDARTGEVRFSFPLPITESPEMGVLSGPLVDGEGAIYFGGHDDFVYSLSRTGALRWAFRVEGDVDAPPMLDADGTLYIGCDDGRLYAIERSPSAADVDAGVSDAATVSTDAGSAEADAGSDDQGR